MKTAEHSKEIIDKEMEFHNLGVRHAIFLRLPDI